MRGQSSKLLPLFVVCALIGCDESTPVPTNVEKAKPVVPGPVDADAPEEFTTTQSGLKYRIRRKSTGTKANPDQAVTANFRGWLDDGTIFDTTYGTGGTPRSIELKVQLAGVMEGAQLIGEGGMIELEVPPKLGYGEAGFPPSIPANATLHFVMEVAKVFDPPKTPEQTVPGAEDGGSGLQPGPVDPDAPEEFTTTATGLKYRIRRKSTGEKPRDTDYVKVHYRGWLDNKRIFDSSYSKGTPTSFNLREVIKGWTEGLQHVSVGGMIELEIPPELGYGAAGSPPAVPGNATLHFTIELIEIK